MNDNCLAFYRKSIEELNVYEQAFTTIRKTWAKAEERFEWLRRINSSLFGTKLVITLSRNDVFAESDQRLKIIKAIYWGYPRGKRGNNFVRILSQIDKLEDAIHSVSGFDTLTISQFEHLCKTFASIDGLGPSTQSKLLYFFRFSIQEMPCLILDRRLIEIFTVKQFIDFSELAHLRYHNAMKNYVKYLQVMDGASKKLNTNADKIELYLYSLKD